MILNEQLYRRKRTYYHGSKIGNLKVLELKPIRSSRIKVVYITQNPNYAFHYAQPNGFLYVCRLIKPINVFNGFSKVDRFKLSKKMGGHTDEELNDICRKDWLVLRALHFGRLEKHHLIDTIAELGYDGFYNNENLNIDFKKLSGIGLFDSSLVEIKDSLDEKEAKEKIKSIGIEILKEKSDDMVNEFLKKYGTSLKEIGKLSRKEQEKFFENLSELD